MSSLRSHEGYLLVDLRESPGVPDSVIQQAVAAGKVISGPTQGMVEAATITCSHCQVQMIRNPGRVRARGYCPKCDHYVCDGCEAARVASGVCRPLTQVFDVLQEQAARAENLVTL